MLIVQNVSYIHPNKNLLFSNINFTVNPYHKIALVGNNGTGKSTLLNIIAGKTAPAKGQITTTAAPYYIPQVFGQYNHLTVAQALQVEQKLHALKSILNGNVTEEMYALLNDDWTIEQRCNEALQYWQLTELDMSQKMETLSGGQKTKVFLAGISIHQPELILLDEPSNHLDFSGRTLLYNFIRSAKNTMIIVSHDRELLRLLDMVYELSNGSISICGGNYDFYMQQKLTEHNALNQDIQTKEKALRKAKEKEREIMERKQKLDARGKNKQEKSGVARIMMNTMRNKAENSTSKIKGMHAEKIGGIAQELQELRAALPQADKMKFGFNNSSLHKGKILFRATGINISFNILPVWKENVHFQIFSGERIALQGANGSGKTTLIKLILGDLQPQTGQVYRASNKSIYIDQDYSLLKEQLSVYEQAQEFNNAGLPEHEIKTRLNRFLFTKEDWDKRCSVLSGGERMRLTLCCLTISRDSPDTIILDEPTNNLDIQNIEMLTLAINEYQGALIIVSHDAWFLEQAHIERVVQL